MEVSEEVRFSSAPALVRAAVLAYLKSRFPEALPFIRWDSSETHASAARLGASGTLELAGTGPTLMVLKGRVGFPASLSVSEAQVKTHLNQAIRDLKNAVP